MQGDQRDVPLAKGISIQTECPVGLIGDDIEAVAKKMSNELGIPIIPVRCEGFRGDAWASWILLEEMGLRVIAQWSGDGTINELMIAHKSKLKLIHCHRSMNYMCTTMEREYGIPWMEYNFFGPTKTIQSLRAIADRFDDHIRANCEKVIAKYQVEMDAIIGKYRPRLEGEKVMLLIGGLRPRHTIGAYEDLGMEIVA